MKKIYALLISVLLAFAPVLSGCATNTDAVTITTDMTALEYTGAAYVTINGNQPDFDDDDFKSKSYEHYSELDSLGRAGVAEANIGIDIMPTEERGKIGNIKPSGWQTVKYDFVDGKYLYNRCHLIGYQLSGENANEKNLITGTRYMNVEGMLPFENMVADFVEDNDMHVLYRVTPVYDGDNLLASGVQIEACSMEDKGAGICFNVFCFNVQPGVTIDYATGESRADSSVSTADKTDNSDTEEIGASAENEPKNESEEQSNTTVSYILNTNSMKFHYPDCSGAKKMKEENKKESSQSREEIINMGYSPCGTCKP